MSLTGNRSWGRRGAMADARRENCPGGRAGEGKDTAAH